MYTGFAETIEIVGRLKNKIQEKKTTQLSYQKYKYRHPNKMQSNMFKTNGYLLKHAKTK